MVKALSPHKLTHLLSEIIRVNQEAIDNGTFGSAVLERLKARDEG